MLTVAITLLVVGLVGARGSPLLSNGVIASGSEDASARLWNGANYAAVGVLSDHAEQVTGLAFSADGSLLATASIDMTAKVWRDGELLQTFAVSDVESVRSVSFSPDSTRLATAARDMLGKVFSVATGKLLLTLAGHVEPVYGIAFSPAGERIVTASRDRTLKTWNSTSGEELLTFTGHTSFIWGVAWSADGASIYSTGTDGSLILWDAATAVARYAAPTGQAGGCWSLALSPSGEFVATGGQDGSIAILGAADGAVALKIPQAHGGGGPAGRPTQVYGLAFSPDSQRLASGGLADGVVKVWDVATGVQLAGMEGHTAYVRAVAWSI